MKTVNWHDGQKLGPADLNCQSLFMEQGIADVINVITGRHTSILDIGIDLEYLSSDIFKITQLIAVIAGKVVTYPYLNKDSLVYAADQINLKTVELPYTSIYARVEPYPVSKVYHVGKVPFNVPRIKLSTSKISEEDILICNLVRDEASKWRISTDYIPSCFAFNGIYKQLIFRSLDLFMQEILAYIDEQKRYSLDNAQAFLLYNLESMIAARHYQLSENSEQPVNMEGLVKDFIQMHQCFERYHKEKNSGEPFIIKASNSMSSIITNFKKSMQSLMLEGRKDEKISLHPEGDILCAKIDFSQDISTNKRYYLFVMKPYSDFAYNPKMIRLAAPSRMSVLRNLNIPGIKLLHKNYNPTSLTVEKKYYDIFEVISSRELDYVLAEGFVACDQETLPKDLRVFLVKNYSDSQGEVQERGGENG